MLNRLITAGGIRTYAAALAGWALAAAPFAPAHADHLPAVASRPALQVAAPSHVMMLGGARAGSRLVAAGLHGVILLSDDNGITWRQAPSPTSVALTGAAFADPKDGWIIGHLGVVLHTVDGGQTWTRQLDGIRAASLALAAAKQESTGPGDPNVLQANLQNARQLVSDGPDKPFLAIAVTDAEHALIVGAYGIAFQTQDAGAHWQAVQDRFGDGDGWHIYALAETGATRYAAGEQGLFLRSTASGVYQSITLPDQLSIFGLLTTPTGRIIAYGLDGLFETSDDQGNHWNVVTTGVANSFTSALTLPDGRLLFASQVGQLLVSTDNGSSLHLLTQMSLQPIAGMILAKDGSIITLGTSGALRLILNKAARNS